MAKNIILCSDGTGNKGGTGSDTNVFKLYHAIKGGTNRRREIKGDASERRQISFYDNGVGTASLSVLRGIGGATGFGFRRNVVDVYEFASRHYEDGDDIYAFGFSRGAATIRAFAGMVRHFGLVKRHTGQKDANGNEIIMEEAEFQRQIDVVMKRYSGLGGGVSLGRIWQSFRGKDLNYDKQDADIQVLGVWDTVAALGFPQIPWLDATVNFFRRHKFYDYSPNAKVKHIFHAVAIDDERRTFWPLIWDETKCGDDQHIEQVWFPGVHSNVGGGYPRAGLANVALDWMIARLEAHRHSLENGDPASKKGNSGRGLKLETSFLEDVRDGGNASGKLYDSRAGFAMMYRYQPRPIAKLCDGRLRENEPVRLHASVLDRLELRTAGYCPGRIPDCYCEVATRTEDLNEFAPLMSPVLGKLILAEPVDTDKNSDWKKIRKKINGITTRRIGLYWTFLTTSIVLLLVSVYFWAKEFELSGYGEDWRDENVLNAALGHASDVLNYFLPEIFESIIHYGVLVNPSWVAGLLVVIAFYYVLRSIWRRQSDRACETARRQVLDRRRTTGDA